MSAKITTLGEHVATQKGFAFKSAWFCDSGRPVVKVKDFTADSVDPDEVTHVSDEIAAQYLKYQLRTGDVVIQTVGSWPSAPASVVGKCVRIPRSVDRALLNQNAVKISPSSSLDGGFLYYLLKNPAFGEYIVGTAQGAASQAAITLEAIRAYKISVPDLATQRKIAGTLSAYDDLLENNLRRIKILEKMAQSLYREWFVHFRFPGHESARFTDSSLGQIPKGWEVMSFSQTAEFLNGFAFKPRHLGGEGKPIIKIKELKNGITNDTPRYDGDEIAPKYCVQNGDLLFSWSADLEAYIWKSGDGYLNQHLFSVAPRSGITKTFLFFALKERMQEFRNRSLGTTMRHIKRSALDEVEVLLPPAELRLKFEALASSTLQMQGTLEMRNQNLRSTRNLLLPKLLNIKAP